MADKFKTHLQQSFATPSQSFFDTHWLFPHGLSPLLLVFIIHCERCNTFAQRTGDTRHGTSCTTWEKKEYGLRIIREYRLR